MTNNMNLTAILDRIALAGGNHIKITHYALTNPDRAIDLLTERMLDIINDRLVEADDKGAELNAAIDALQFAFGPLVHRELINAATREVNHIRTVAATTN